MSRLSTNILSFRIGIGAQEGAEIDRILKAADLPASVMHGDPEFVDLATEFRAAARSTEPPTQLFLAGDRYHPNALGYGIVADRVLAAIERE